LASPSREGFPATLFHCGALCRLGELGRITTGEVLDEASRAGRTAASFPAAAEDYFRDMDGGGSLTREEIQDRRVPRGLS
jgi:hypothetical protein